MNHSIKAGPCLYVGALSILMLFLAACCQSTDGPAEPNWQEQYDLGVRYLSEGNYEEAIIAFTAAIEIEPMQADAYLKLANLYLQQENYEAALEIINKGLSNCDSSTLERLKDKVYEAMSQPYRLTIRNETPQWGVLRAYRTVPDPNIKGALTKDKEIISGDTIPQDDNHIIFDVTDIAPGYRIGKMNRNGSDSGTFALITGGYGMCSTDIDEHTDIIFSMEPIPDVLPQVPAVSISNEPSSSDENRVLRVMFNSDTFPSEWASCIWEYREPDSNEWTELIYWRGHTSCRVKPFGGQLVDLTGKYVRVTAQGLEYYSSGTSISEEYLVAE